MDLGKAIKIEQGHHISFPGGLRHGGDPITSGTRYILAIFLYVCSIDQDSQRNLFSTSDFVQQNDSSKMIHHSEPNVSQIFIRKYSSSTSTKESTSQFSFNFDSNLEK